MNRYLPFLMCLAIFGAGCTASPTTSATTSTQQQVIQGRTVDFSDRRLTSIPMNLFSQTDIENLNLSSNQLTGAPQSQIGKLQNLKTLNLSNNKLTGLPAELGQLKNLETLDVSNNLLTGLPMELGNLTQLKVLDITGNPYSQQDLDAIAKRLPNTEIRK